MPFGTLVLLLQGEGYFFVAVCFIFNPRFLPLQVWWVGPWPGVVQPVGHIFEWQIAAPAHCRLLSAAGSLALYILRWYCRLHHGAPFHEDHPRADRPRSGSDESCSVGEIHGTAAAPDQPPCTVSSASHRCCVLLYPACLPAFHVIESGGPGPEPLHYTGVRRSASTAWLVVPLVQCAMWPEPSEPPVSPQ